MGPFHQPYPTAARGAPEDVQQGSVRAVKLESAPIVDAKGEQLTIQKLGAAGATLGYPLRPYHLLRGLRGEPTVVRLLDVQRGPLHGCHPDSPAFPDASSGGHWHLPRHK